MNKFAILRNNANGKMEVDDLLEDLISKYHIVKLVAHELKINFHVNSVKSGLDIVELKQRTVHVIKPRYNLETAQTYLTKSPKQILGFVELYINLVMLGYSSRFQCI